MWKDEDGGTMPEVVLVPTYTETLNGEPVTLQITESQRYEADNKHWQEAEWNISRLPPPSWENDPGEYWSYADVVTRFEQLEARVAKLEARLEQQADDGR